MIIIYDDILSENAVIISTMSKGARKTIKMLKLNIFLQENKAY